MRGADCRHIRCFCRPAAMNIEEQAITFRCNAAPLYGIVSQPDQPSRRGVLVVVGGPQYRVGSHRQFVLLARSLAAQGYACLRFDVRGMGDSAGAARTFEDIGEDIGAAIDAFLAAVPAVQEVVIWGLCDAASAALFYAGHDQRVAGLVLLNPWARTTGGLAKATLKHYYLDRLRQPALWKKIAAGQFDYGAAARSFVRLAGMGLGIGGQDGAAAVAPQLDAAMPAAPADAVPPLPQRMLAGLGRFEGKVLLITCDSDLTAQEFIDATRQSREWKRQLAAPRVTHRTVPDADHTFSRRSWRDDVARWTGDWIGSW
jgi:exosortase A-associated hydrolase 1